MTDSKNNQLALLLANLQKEFLENLPSRIDAIENIILKLENRNQIEELYRLAHNLKGAAGTYNLHIVSRICHQFEEYLKHDLPADTAQQKKYASYLLNFIDLMREANRIATEKNPDYSMIDAALDKIINKAAEKNLKILIVDNSQSTLKLLKTTFTKPNIELHIFTDGFAAIEQLTLNKYDLLVTGDEVPTYSGRAIISAVKLGNNRNKKMHTVLLTSKKLPGKGRDSDPDYVLARDAELINNLNSIIMQLIQH